MQTEQLIRQRVAQLQTTPTRQRPQKTYLSKADRQEAMVLAAIAGKLDTLVDGWTERGRQGSLLRAGKLSRYWAYVALDELTRGVDQSSIDALMREIGRADISVEVTH